MRELAEDMDAWEALSLGSSQALHHRSRKEVVSFGDTHRVG